MADKEKLNEEEHDEDEVKRREEERVRTGWGRGGKVASLV